MSATLEWLIERLKEPTTYAGLGLIVMAVFGFNIEMANAVLGAILVVLGALAVYLKEKGKVVQPVVIETNADSPEVPKGPVGPLPSILFALVLVGTLLAGCVAANVQTQLLLACQTYTQAEFALRPFAPRMTEEQKNVVRQSIRTTEPICTGEEVGDMQSALDIVRSTLRELVTVQNQVEPKP